MARHTKILLFGLLIVAIGAGLIGSIGKRNANDSILSPIAEEVTKEDRVAKLEEIMAANPDKNSQKYQEARQEFCLLTARPVAEREQAVAHIRQYLGMPDVPVEFVCTRGETEYYEAARFSFSIDRNSNLITETAEAERRWGKGDDGTRWTEPAPEYDYSATYTTLEEIKPVAEAFMRKNQNIFGIDIDQMAFEYVGSKVGNYFLEWSNKGKTVRICILESGQVVNYSTQ